MQTILTARTDFSIGESILTTEKLIAQAKAAKAKVVGVTDTMSITSMIDLTNRAKKEGLKPVIGCRLRLVDDPSWRRTPADKKAPPEYFAIAYILSEEGLKAIFRLLTLANSDGRFYNVPKLSFDDLQAELRKLGGSDLALTTGDALSVLHHPDHERIVFEWTQATDAVFVHLTAVDLPYYDAVNARAARLASKLALPCLVARPACYEEGGADAAEIMTAISRNQRVNEIWHWQPAHRDLHIKDQAAFLEEVKGAAVRLRDRFGFKDAGSLFRAAISSTDQLADLVTYEWTKQPVSLPAMAPDEYRAVVEECKKGWVTRFASPVFGHKPTTDELRDVYRARLVYELEVLRKLGFSGYFLLVQDVVRFAKSNGILVGPGRGSVGGSLVAYLMGITDCDPLRFGLLFERFINPDRIDLPDADLDFMSERRHEVIEYLVGKYGRERVAGISNFGTLGSASAIRDTGRVFNLAEQEYACSKMVPKLHGVTSKLEVAAEEVAEIDKFRTRFKTLWPNLLKLEGVNRNLSQHAAGVVVGGCDLVERGVIERRSGEAVMCWDKRIVEDMGLVKMDILGLSTLDLIAKCLAYIRRRHSKKVDLMRIPLDDKKVLDAFAVGQTTGIFQFESGGMRRLLKELGKDGTITFDDITAATALYRPGPMDSGMMDSYYKRKQGLESVEFDHPKMEEALTPTYGVMVYQEQVMQVARDVAGYSMADADKLRKIMGKKLPEEMKKERGKFVSGCVATVGMSEDDAGDLFDKIEKFAGYGFNKSHSVEYTLISYQAMWLKTYYTVEFFASALSLMKEEKLAALLKDAERHKIEVLLPDINHSSEQFEIVTDAALAIPFGRIKGLSNNAAKAIVEARSDGKGRFLSIKDFTERVNRRLLNKGKVDLLNRVGAFAGCPDEVGQLPAKHPDRIRDQIDLIPGLITDTVPVNRDFTTSRVDKAKVGALLKHARDAVNPGTVKPHFGKTASFMGIFDAPTKGEAEAQFFSFGGNWDWVSNALYENSMARESGYWTGLVKLPKEGKQVSASEIDVWLPYLKKEIDILKPPVIVLLGSQVARVFFPDLKGKASDHAGKVMYRPDLDANIVLGFNPGEIYHDPDKQESLNAVFAAVANLTEV